MSLNVVDLFCGCGGLSKGFEDADYNIILGVDNWDDSLHTFKKNHKNSEILNADIFKLTGSDILKTVNNKSVDVVIGGPPCQGFSLAGLRQKDDERNMLVFQFARIINELKPKAFVMENVIGILSMNDRKVKEDLLKEFNKIGYVVGEPKTLSAHHYGVPQMRKRVFFIGIRKDLNKIPTYPAQTHFDPDLIKQNLNLNKLKSYVTVGDAISDLPLLEDCGEEISDYKTTANSEYQKEMRKKSKKLYNHTCNNHTEQTKKIISLVPEGGSWVDLPKEYQNVRSFSNTWKRLDSKKPSVTIDCGHRHHFHYKANRVPTVRESARIQSFSDDFIFTGSKTSQFKQVGNAVPPLLAKAVALELKKKIES